MRSPVLSINIINDMLYAILLFRLVFVKTNTNTNKKKNIHTLYSYKYKTVSYACKGMISRIFFYVYYTVINIRFCSSFFLLCNYFDYH